MKNNFDPKPTGTNDSGIDTTDWDNEVLSETEVQEG